MRPNFNKPISAGIHKILPKIDSRSDRAGDKLSWNDGALFDSRNNAERVIPAAVNRLLFLYSQRCLRQARSGHLTNISKY